MRRVVVLMALLAGFVGLIVTGQNFKRQDSQLSSPGAAAPAPEYRGNLSPGRPILVAQSDNAAQADVPADQASAPTEEDLSKRYSEAGFYEGEAGLSPSAAAGREIWYKATAGNARFHTYVFQQRVGVMIDWHRVLRSDQRGDRFRAWGIINDPGCCAPGSPGCPAKSLEETYGFDWCPGDDELLKFVGKSGYQDPACKFRDAPLDTKDAHAKDANGTALDQRESACNLDFGTSTGALGIRKFPNPRFDAERWKQLNGGLASWEGYNKKLSDNPANLDSRVSRLADGGIEPPFLIGTSCGSCHIAFDPLNPPADAANPKWENIKALVGNQYTRFSEILGSGMPRDSLEFQVFAHARPGTTDTSAITYDSVNNPGTINALINIPQRPTFNGEDIIKWRKTNACKSGETDDSCWCEPGRQGKCWQRSRMTENGIHHILKGGEDSIGALEAIQRVYFNIGSCSEQCLMNHLTDMRQLDPQQRGFGQTPFIIGQCRRDCPNFRAIEDRLANILDFFLSKEAAATDLREARENEKKRADPKSKYDQGDFAADLDAEFGKGALARGREIFVENCARCHSSIPESEGGPFKDRDFLKVSEQSGLRADWLGNDKPTSVNEVGTFRCRALHSNHMAGHLWQEYGSETLRAQAPDPNLTEPHEGGRGYYRNISLLNAWAHAPFMHNNAIGPELCGNPANKQNEFHRDRYVDQSGALLASQPACWEYDPSVEGRYKLFKASVEELLNPNRPLKITKLESDVAVDIGPRLWDEEKGAERRIVGFTLVLPKGTNAGSLGNFRYKELIGDFVRLETKRDELQAKLAARLGADRAKAALETIGAMAKELIAAPGDIYKVVAANDERKALAREIYSNCTADVENGGHAFGTSLSPEDKKALTAFLATL